MQAPSPDPSALPPPSLEAARGPYAHFAPPPEPPLDPGEAPLVLSPLEPLPISETLADWKEMLWDALGYPHRKDGWFILLPGAVLAAVLVISCFAPRMAFYSFPLPEGYFAVYYVSVIHTTVNGRDQPPDWPSVTDTIFDLLLPCGQVALAFSLSTLPAIACRLLVPDHPGLCLALAILGALYFPMALLSTVMQDTFASLLPHQVVPAIVRSWRGYLVVTGFLLAVSLVVSVLLAMVLYVELFAGIALAFVAWFWFVMVHGRLLGLFYLKYQQRFDW